MGPGSRHSQRAAGLTSCFCVTNDHIPPALDSTHLLSPSSRGQESGRLNWVLCVGSHQAAVNVLARANSRLEAPLGEGSTPLLAWLLAAFSSLQLWYRELENFCWFLEGGCPQLLVLERGSPFTVPCHVRHGLKHFFFFFYQNNQPGK